MAKLELKNLRKEYSSKVIPVKDISIDVEDGEFLTFVGPSGCGKSTLLRMIAGLDQPTRGQVVIGGKNVNDVAPGKRNIAMVFQSYALYPHMTVAENISASLKLRKIPKDDITHRVGDVANRLGIQHLLDRKPGQMSGGQRQRVALARALVRDPEVFLLDEPLSNLDALLREQVRGELKQLFETQQKPVVYVTHDQTEAMTLSTKIAVLSDGILQQLDSPNRIYSRPANQFVAGFMGSPQMNLLTLQCQGNQAVLGHFQIPLSNLKAQPKQVVMGIRPEDVRVVESETPYTVKGKVFLEEDLGKERLISVRVTGSELVLRSLVPADYFWEGEYVTLLLVEKQLHWFDVESGDRLNTDEEGIKGDRINIQKKPRVEIQEIIEVEERH